MIFNLFIQVKVKLRILLLFPQICLCSLNFTLITWLHNSWFGCCQTISINKIFIQISWCSNLSFNESHICTGSIIFYLVCDRKWLGHILKLYSLSLFDNHVLGNPPWRYKSLCRSDRKCNRFFVYVYCRIQLSLCWFT